MSKQIYFDAMKEKGKLDATDLQTRSAGMTGTELYAEDGKIPSFAAAVARKNMLERKVGFVCRSTAGRVVKLLQNYDSTVYPRSRRICRRSGASSGPRIRKRRCLSSL